MMQTSRDIGSRPNGIAPLPSRGNKGNKGGRVARAWQEIWDSLDKHTWRDGYELADMVGRRHDLARVTVLSHLSLMASEGVLSRRHEYVQVRVQRGSQEFDSMRKHTFYRIPS